jgi:Raf kinase inhibitor-like YbhB/YbcL family protein
MKSWMLIIFLAIFSGHLTGEEPMSLRLVSQVFKNNEAIPSKYTCDGKNISPPLKWEGVPQGTKSLVLIVDDPDAPSKTWTHWVVFNISSTTTECREGAAPDGSLQGINDFGQAAYGGPCPPKGMHRYYFKLYALDASLTLQEGATKEQVETEMKAHILAEAQLIGTYSRTLRH